MEKSIGRSLDYFEEYICLNGNVLLYIRVQLYMYIMQIHIFMHFTMMLVIHKIKKTKIFLFMFPCYWLLSGFLRSYTLTNLRGGSRISVERGFKFTKGGSFC